MQTFFLILEVIFGFFLVEFGEIPSSLGKLGQNCPWYALIWKNCAKNQMQTLFSFWGIILWSFFGRVCKIWGQKSFAPLNICLLVHLLCWLTKCITKKVVAHT